MKVMMIEASAEELRANKRVADAIVDAFSDFCDTIIKRGHVDVDYAAMLSEEGSEEENVEPEDE